MEHIDKDKRDDAQASFHRQGDTYHGFNYTSCGPLDGISNSSVGPPGGIDLITHCTRSGCSTTELSFILIFFVEILNTYSIRLMKIMDFADMTNVF